MMQVDNVYFVWLHIGKKCFVSEIRDTAIMVY